jgi:prophage regulatory protein
MERLLTKKQLREFCVYCPAHIARLEKVGKFPKRVRLGTGRVAWRFSDIEAWQNARFADS